MNEAEKENTRKRKTSKTREEEREKQVQRESKDTCNINNNNNNNNNSNNGGLTGRPTFHLAAHRIGLFFFLLLPRSNKRKKTFFFFIQIRIKIGVCVCVWFIHSAVHFSLHSALFDREGTRVFFIFTFFLLFCGQKTRANHISEKSKRRKLPVRPTHQNRLALGWVTVKPGKTK